ncbi:hypothetical protein GCM10023311_23890 [Flaviramulus aquimarinus]|uniref:DUF4386 domain-containing protein n=1 Tax=Flaviramulus aquimarinus TaxID=1170456 RepID=A0ABP9FEK8_9FLAO
MENNFYKITGLSLTIGSFLAITTMIIHPAGGNIEHIIELSKPLQFTHSLAIFCLPFILFGFYGLTHKLSDKWKISTLAFIIIGFGLVAAMLAALFNGLALTFFLNQYSDNLEQNITIVKPIVSYGFAINKGLDYIFIVSFCLAIAIYSLIIIFSKKLPKLIGYLGITILIFAVIGAATNFVFTSHTGFRIFVFSIAGWILYSGISLIKPKRQ